MYISVSQKLNYSPGGTVYVFDGASWSNVPGLPDIGYGDLVAFNNGTGEKLFIGDGNDIRTYDGTSNPVVNATLTDYTGYLTILTDGSKEWIYTGGTDVYYNPPCQ